MTKEQEWTRRIREQARSGQSASEWCREQGVSDKAFYYWKKRLKTEVTPGTGFVKVGNKEPLELVLREGITIRIPEGFDGEALRRIVEVLSC